MSRWNVAIADDNERMAEILDHITEAGFRFWQSSESPITEKKPVG